MGVEAYKEKAHVTHGFWKGLMNEMGAVVKAKAPELT
jgi:hypothetical protein